MLTLQRKKLILELLARDGQIVAKRLSEEFGLSEDTIRRDLRELAAEGLLQRVHGGALPASPSVADLKARRNIATSEKQDIGRAAAGLIKDGQTIAVDGGTTAIELARNLASGLRATLVTHSPSVAAELEAHPNVDVLLIGGRLFRHSMVTVGALAAEQISRLRFDVFFLGVTGIHAVEGLTTGDAEEAAIKRALMSRAAETIVLGSSEKLGAVSPCLVAPLADASAIIVHRTCQADSAEAIARAGASLIRA